MAHEIIVAMNVTDPDGYARYREAIRPLLESVGAWFRHDFVVSDVLASEAGHPVTRVFALVFPDRSAREAFFADPRYREAKQEHYVRSVNGFTILCEHDPERG